MTPLFTKLNLGTHRSVLVLNAPASFEPELAALQEVALHRAAPKGAVPFALAFARTLAQRDALSAQLAQATQGDAVVWLAYPKASSKHLRSEFTRDSGWAVLGAAGFEPVRQVAVDEDWSALRFRRAEFIKTLARHPDGAESTLGRARALAAKAKP
jgi:hypothetical protein